MTSVPIRIAWAIHDLIWGWHWSNYHKAYVRARKDFARFPVLTGAVIDENHREYSLNRADRGLSPQPVAAQACQICPQ